MTRGTRRRLCCYGAPGSSCCRIARLAGGFARVRASEDLTSEDYALSVPVRPGNIVRLTEYCTKQKGANDARL
jgi:hypothetical protein